MNARSSFQVSALPTLFSRSTSSKSEPVATSVLRLGTRGSALALWQADAVRDALLRDPEAGDVDLVVIKPEGDLDKQSSLMAIGGRGVFSSALQAALLDGTVDLAVHSAKDVPTISPVGLQITAFPQREDAHDAVVSRHGVSLAELPPNPVIGTSSRRRAVQVQAIRPDATIVDLRGNIDTRLQKSATDSYDAVILAAAGLVRMGWQDRIVEYLNFDVFVPSPGQGALAVETRVAPDRAVARVARLNHPEVAAAVALERLFLTTMAGGCSTPIGAHALLQGEAMRFWAMIGSDDGKRLIHTYEELSPETTNESVPELAHRMLRDLGPSWRGTGPVDASQVEQPLAGRQALVTGTRTMIDGLREAFVAEGAPVLEAPTLDIQPTRNPSALREALGRASAGYFDWLVVTSQHAVPALVDFGTEYLQGKVRVAAVGPSTAEAVRAAGLDVELVPHPSTGEALASALQALSTSIGRVLLLLGSNARDVLPAVLADAGIRAERVEAYDAVPVTELSPVIVDAIHANSIDIVTFASPSAAQRLVAMLGPGLAALSGACLVAIGPTTTEAMEALGLPVHAVAEDPSPSGIISSCRTYFGERFGHSQFEPDRTPS